MVFPRKPSYRKQDLLCLICPLGFHFEPDRGSLRGERGVLRGSELDRGERGGPRAAGYGRARSSSALRKLFRATRLRNSVVTVDSCSRHLKNNGTVSVLGLAQGVLVYL